MKNDEMWTLSTNFREALADAEQWEIVNLFPGFKMPEWVRKLFTTAAKLVEQWFATDNDAEASHGLGTKATQSFEEAGEALSKALRGFFHGSSKHFSDDSVRSGSIPTLAPQGSRKSNARSRRSSNSPKSRISALRKRVRSTAKFTRGSWPFWQSRRW